MTDPQIITVCIVAIGLPWLYAISDLRRRVSNIESDQEPKVRAATLARDTAISDLNDEIASLRVRLAKSEARCEGLLGLEPTRETINDNGPKGGGE